MKNDIKVKTLFSLLIAILITLVCLSCERIPDPKVEIILKEGLIFKQGERKPYTGVVNDTLEGKLIEYHVVDGKKNGEFKTYFKNGRLEMIGLIKENLNQGKWTYYYQSGKVESEGIFKDDLPDGTWKWFYENGNLREEGGYVKGNREGPWVQYDIDGKVKEKKMLEKNQVKEIK